MKNEYEQSLHHSKVLASLQNSRTKIGFNRIIYGINPSTYAHQTYSFKIYLNNGRACVDINAS